MNLNSLTSPTDKSSPISNKLLQLDADCKLNSDIATIGEEKTLNPVLVPNDLLIFNADNDKVAVRITATDIDSLLPELTNRGFEVLGVAAEFNIIEGYIGLDVLPSLKELTDAGLLGVIPLYQPITNVENAIAQAENHDDQLIIKHENSSLNEHYYGEYNTNLMPSYDSKNTLNNDLEIETLAEETDNNLLSLGSNFTKNHDIIQNDENEVIYPNIFETATNEIDLDINNII